MAKNVAVIQREELEQRLIGLPTMQEMAEAVDICLSKGIRRLNDMLDSEDPTQHVEATYALVTVGKFVEQRRNEIRKKGSTIVFDDVTMLTGVGHG